MRIGAAMMLNAEENSESKKIDLPTLEMVQNEYDRITDHTTRKTIWRRTLFGLATVSAVSVLIAVLLLPVLQIYGESMNPTLHEGDIVLSVKGSDFEPGDIVSFYYNNNILVKRVIATAGEWVDIDKDGIVSVDGVVLYEPYIQEHSLGSCDITLPYQVPEGCIFVLGDHRSTSKDSRSSSMGPIPYEKVVGRIVFRLWPFHNLGKPIESYEIN